MTSTSEPMVECFDFEYPEWAIHKFGWKERLCPNSVKPILSVIDRGFSDWYGMTRFMYAGRSVIDYTRTRDSFQVTVFYSNPLLDADKYTALCRAIEEQYQVTSVFRGAYGVTYKLSY